VERDEGDDVGLIVDDENAFASVAVRLSHRRGAARRLLILATIISMATGL
jgi:hypothetical protein